MYLKKVRSFILLMLVLVLFIGMTSSAFAWSNVHTIGDLGELHDQLMRAVSVNPETGVSAITRLLQFR